MQPHQTWKTNRSISDLNKRYQTLSSSNCRCSYVDACMQAHILALHQTYALRHNTPSPSHTNTVYIPRRAYQAVRACFPLAGRPCWGLLRCLMMSSVCGGGGKSQNHWAVWTECTYIVNLHVCFTAYNSTHTNTQGCSRLVWVNEKSDLCTL